MLNENESIYFARSEKNKAFLFIFVCIENNWKIHAYHKCARKNSVAFWQIVHLRSQGFFLFGVWMHSKCLLALLEIESRNASFEKLPVPSFYGSMNKMHCKSFQKQCVFVLSSLVKLFHTMIMESKMISIFYLKTAH